MDRMNENKVEGAGAGICRDCVFFMRYDELSGREDVCMWRGKNRRVVCKVVRCDGYRLRTED